MAASAWQRVQQATGTPGYGHRYRRHVLDALRYPDLQDLATSGDHVPELDDVYVDLALISPAGGDGDDRATLGALLDGDPPAVVTLVGQPGSGKTTLLAHAARRSARAPLFSRRGTKRVPVVLALREHAPAIAGDPAVPLTTLARVAAAGAGGREPAGWWERQLNRGRCLVLLDGLDEVARAEDRSAVAAWVERQAAAYPGNHFVLTSRPGGLDAAAAAGARVIRPLTAEQVRLFTERWSLAAEQHATGARGGSARRATQARARESAARLLTLLRDHPALRELAGNPLLLTMIATAYRYRGALPGSRADLYGEISRVLLSRRAQPGDRPELLAWPAKQALLAALAFQMMREHVTELPGGRVLEILGPQLARFPAAVTGETFLDDIARAGLVTEAAPGRYAFTHLTFQEYLAARHVSATPELVKDLAGSVDDPWWHEAIRLYAATADASPVIRACLDSGTIPSLTLAFDCDEASTEIDPELRRQLAAERQRAFAPGCPPEHRRLIAGVLAARLTRQTVATAGGTRICVRPVPADLYWLFLADTGAPAPDRPCDPSLPADGAAAPAAGLWGPEAHAFTGWLNSVTAAAAGIEVRLPRAAELDEPAVAEAVTSRLPALVTGAWTGPNLSLWLRGGQAHPHELPGTAVIEAVAADARGTTLLTQVLTAAVLDVTLRIIRDLADARALATALAGDLVARATSDGQLIDLMHAHAHALVRTYAHARELTRADAITRTREAGPELAARLDAASARALADVVAGDLAAAIERAGAHAAELAEAVDLDLSVLSAFDFDVAQATALARVHDADLDRAYVLARGLLHDPALALPAALHLPSSGGLDPELPLPGVLGLALRWVADGPLAAALLEVLAAGPAGGDPHLAFARTLTSRARIGETTMLRAALGHPLTGPLGNLASAAPRRAGRSPGWSQATVLSGLAEACAPLWTAHQPPDLTQAAALRAVTLALAGDPGLPGEPGADAAGVLRTAAATVTLVQRRADGAAAAGEAVILALV